MNTRRAAAKQGATGSVPNKAAAEKQGSAGQARRSSRKNQKASSSSSSSSMPVIPQINAAPNPPSATMFPKMGHQTTYHCSWASVGMNGCLLPDESLQSCTRCAIRVHPRCQLNWESLNDYDDESTAGIYCCRHHPGRRQESESEDSASAGGGSSGTGLSCDWVEAHMKVCKYSSLPTKVCGVDGCNKLVHHLCQINWETENKVELGGGKLRCREHHPDCNVLLGYADGKQKVAPPMLPPPQLPPPQPPLPSNNPQTTASPYRAVLNFLGERMPSRFIIGASPLFGSSPADSTITGGATRASIAIPTTASTRSVAASADSTAAPVQAIDQDPNPYFNEEEDIDNKFWEDFNESGDGGDSDQEGDLSMLHNDAVHAKTILSTSGEVIDADEDDIDDEGEPSSRDDMSAAASSSSGLLGAPARWEPPGPPPTWTSYTVNDKKHDAPEEEHIDNPGNWHLFSFRPKYDNKQKYLGHFTPAGAKVLNANSGGGSTMILTRALMSGVKQHNQISSHHQGGEA